MFRLNRRALIQLMQRIFVTSLVHVDASTVVAGQYTITWIKARHSIKTSERAIVVAIESGNNAAHKLNTWIVWILLAQHLHLVSRLLLLASCQVDDDHLHSRFENTRFERQRFLESDLCFVMITSLSQTL